MTHSTHSNSSHPRQEIKPSQGVGTTAQKPNFGVKVTSVDVRDADPGTPTTPASMYTQSSLLYKSCQNLKGVNGMTTDEMRGMQVHSA